MPFPATLEPRRTQDNLLLRPHQPRSCRRSNLTGSRAPGAACTPVRTGPGPSEGRHTHVVLPEAALPVAVGVHHHLGRLRLADGHQPRLHVREALGEQGGEGGESQAPHIVPQASSPTDRPPGPGDTTEGHRGPVRPGGVPLGPGPVSMATEACPGAAGPSPWRRRPRRHDRRAYPVLGALLPQNLGPSPAVSVPPPAAPAR